MIKSFAKALRSGVTAFRRSFDAVGAGDRWPTSSIMWSPVSESLAAAGPISKRADWLSNNSPTAASFVGCWETNLVGGIGPTVRSAHPDPDTARLLETRFALFAKRCDIEGPGDLASVLTKAVRCMVISGDAFLQMVIVDRSLKLKLLATDQVAREWTRVLPTGIRIFAGVEVDAHGHRQAYWVYPHQLDMPWASTLQPERIDASDLLHMFAAKFPGSVRGISWLTPIATRLLELDRCEDAVLARANTAALFCGFIRDLDNAGSMANDAPVNAGATGNQLSMEPGSLRVLPPGTDITFPSNLPDISSMAEFLKHMLRSIASGGGVPSSLLTGDLSDVNYSSSRLGLEQFKRSVVGIQKSLLVGMLLQQIWDRFVLIEVLSGRIEAPDYEENQDDFNAVDFRWPGWPSLDPFKDAQADETALRNNLKSRAEIIAARGRDIEDVDLEIENDPLKPDPAAPQTPAPQLIEAENVD